MSNDKFTLELAELAYGAFLSRCKDTIKLYGVRVYSIPTPYPDTDYELFEIIFIFKYNGSTLQRYARLEFHTSITHFHDYSPSVSSHHFHAYALDNVSVNGELWHISKYLEREDCKKRYKPVATLQVYDKFVELGRI